MITLKNIRLEKKLTQKQAADTVGISIRSYKSYETDAAKINTIKYKYIYDTLKAINPIDEEHGILDIEDIQKKCSSILERYPVQYCILFGSYAKGTAEEKSDIDLLISTELKGLKYYDMVEKLRETLGKKVDVLDVAQLKNNIELLNEILKDGKRIYG